MTMEFTFKNSQQTSNLFSQLALGQIIKVRVLEKLGNSQYIISYKDYQLTAASEIDLMVKVVWLKVTQKHPYPKFQLIIDDNNPLQALLTYAEEHKLLLPELPTKLDEYLGANADDVSMQELYDFIIWYNDKVAWGMLDEKKIRFLLEGGISIKDIMMVYKCFYWADDVDKVGQTYMLANNDKASLVPTKWVSTQNIKSITDDKTLQSQISSALSMITKINTLFLKDNINICLLYARVLSYNMILPIEIYNNSIVLGSFNTKHFGRITFKYKKPAVALFFESSLYINSLKETLSLHAKDNDVAISFNLYNPYSRSSIHA